MKSFNEYVSIGHSDSTADAITSYILDRHLEVDQLTRYAVECQIKDQHVTLAGEVTSKAKFDKDDLTGMVREAISRIGYTNEYAKKWPDSATLNASKVTVDFHLGQQSPDIAQGVDADGWGDQGVFCGMATGDAQHGFMPLSRYYSNAIGKAIYNMALNGDLPVGLDIKTLVTTDENFVERVIVAAPMLPSDETTAKCGISKIIHDLIPSGCGPDEIIINGTGAFVIHSSVGDCGTTGRKLAVNFYGIDCPIGGGAPWSKDGTKADVALNLMCRHRAVRELVANPDMKTVYVKMACCIGKPEVQVAVFDAKWNQIKETTEKLSVRNVVQALKLDKPIYFNLCKNGLFTKVDALARF